MRGPVGLVGLWVMGCVPVETPPPVELDTPTVDSDSDLPDDSDPVDTVDTVEPIDTVQSSACEPPLTATAEVTVALGLTSVRFRDYVLASLGMIPATFLYVYYGKALGSLAAVAGGASVERGTGYWAVLAVGLLATLAVTTLVTRVARRALQQEVEDD